MKENAIKKINTMGKVGTIIALITRILVSILLVLSILGFVATLCMPENLCTVKIAGKADVFVDLAGFDVAFSDEIKKEIESDVKEDADINYAGNSFAVDDVKVGESDIAIGASASLTEFNLKDCIWALVGAIINLTLLLLSTIFAGRLTKAFRNCESPFEKTVIHRMKRFAYSLIPWAVVSSIVGMLESRIWMASSGFHFQIDFGIIIVVLVILALAYIFQYGAVLQQESDETL